VPGRAKRSGEQPNQLIMQLSAAGSRSGQGQINNMAITMPTGCVVKLFMLLLLLLMVLLLPWRRM
jgi:hypothetical protein